MKRFFKCLVKIIIVLAVLRGLISYCFYYLPSSSMAPSLMKYDFVFADRFAYNVKLPFTATTLMELNAAQRGDIIIYRDNRTGADYVKRIIGIGDDKISYNQYSGMIAVTENYKSNQCDMKSCQQTNYRQIDEVDYPNATLLDADKDVLLVQRTEQGAVEHPVLQSKVRYNMAKHYFRQEGYAVGEWVVPQGYYFVMGDNRDNSNDSRFLGFVAQDDLIAKVDKVIFNPTDAERFFIRIK